MTRLLRVIVPAALLLGGCASSGPELKPAPAAAAGAPAGAVALAVSPEQVIAPVNRNVLGGFNFGNWMQVADFAEDLRAVHPAELRFPGGEIGDRTDLTEYVFAAFQANVTILGNPGAVVQTRVGGKSMTGGAVHNRPEDAAEAVRWAKAKGIQVRYWEIGNEPDLYAVKQSDPGYSPEKYCQVFRAQAAAIKAVDPAARVAGPAVSGAPGRDQFLEGFVTACGDVVDVLTWHVYPTTGALEDGPAFDTVREIDDTIDAFTAYWADPAKNPKGSTRKVGLAVTEYGLSSRSDRVHHLADLPAAMWTLEAALRMDARGAASAHYFALQATGGHGLLDQSGARRPTWYAFALLAQLSGDLVAASTADPDLWTHAARDGDRLDVVITNRAAAPKALATRVAGFKLQSGTYFDEAITADEKSAAAIAAAPAVTLPARSVVHLVYRKG